MKKTLLLGLALLLSATLMTGSAFANDGNNKNGDDNSGKNFSAKSFVGLQAAFANGLKDFRQNFKKDFKDMKDMRHFGAVARVTALSGGDSITAEGLGKSEKTFTINTNGKTQFFLKNGDEGSFKDISVGDTLVFNGDVTAKKGSDVVIVQAAKVRIMGDVDFSAKAKVSGEVQSNTTDSADQLTIKTADNENITVNTDNFTTIKDEDGNKLESSDLSAGMMVKIKGFWNSLHSIITALKIKVTGSSASGV